MPEYVPDPVGSVKSLEDLLAYLTRELQKLQGSVGAGGAGGLTMVFKEPARKDGTLALADGVKWNPGSGKGVYAFYNNTWNPMFATAVVVPDPPEEIPPDPEPEPPTAEEPIFIHSFETSVTENGFWSLQAASPSRATLVTPTGGARMGSKAVQLTTMGSDTGIAGSGSNERCDLTLDKSGNQNDGFEGREGWWAWSMMLPDNFQMQSAGQGSPQFWYVTMQWHGTEGGYSPNFGIYLENYDPAGPHLVAIVRGGAAVKKHKQPLFGAEFPQRNIWYDFVQYVKWHSDPAIGRTKLWVRKGNAAQYDLAWDLTAANMYPNQNVYLKPSNYHSNVGQPSSVIYDRIAFGKTPYSVAMAPLQGVPVA